MQGSETHDRPQNCLRHAWMASSEQGQSKHLFLATIIQEKLAPPCRSTCAALGLDNLFPVERSVC